MAKYSRRFTVEFLSNEEIKKEAAEAQAEQRAERHSVFTAKSTRTLGSIWPRPFGFDKKWEH